MDGFINRAACTLVLAFGMLCLHGAAADARAQQQQDTVETVLGALPDDASDARTETVRIAPRELADQNGRDAVMGRIDRAVRRVCRFDETGTLSERAAFESCSRTSRADAEEQLRVLLVRNDIGGLRIASAGAGP